MQRKSIKLKKKICKFCKQEKYIFSKGRCVNCTKQESKPQIKPVSDKKRKEIGLYIKKRLEFFKTHPKCFVCNCDATDIHHMKGRIGSLNLDELFWITVCRECHSKIELNPEWAKENGYSLNRNEKSND